MRHGLGKIVADEIGRYRMMPVLARPLPLRTRIVLQPACAPARMSAVRSPIMNDRGRSMFNSAAAASNMPGTGLAAGTLDLVLGPLARKAFFGMVRAVIDAVQEGVFGAQQRFQLGVRGSQVRFGDEPLGDRRLVRHDNGQVLGAIDLPHRLGHAGQQSHVLGRDGPIVVDIEHAVAIEEDGRAADCRD